MMSLLKLKSKGQVTIPAGLREQFRLSNGDLLEVKADVRGILLVPKVIVDKKDIDVLFERGMRDYHGGKGSGTFASVKEFKASR